MEAIIKLEKLIKEIQEAHNRNLNEVELMQKSYINAIGNISDSAIFLLTDALMYVETHKNYGSKEEALCVAIQEFIDKTRNIESQLKNPK